MSRWKIKFLVCSSVLISSSLFANEASHSLFQRPNPSCGVSTRAGQNCKITADALHPTQLTYGAEEVKRRSDKIATMSFSKLQKYIAAHIVPVVIGPAGDVYITDHHHFAMAMAETFGQETIISAWVVQNWSNQSPKDFWQWMDAQSYTYLFDENGQGPKGVEALPDSIFELKNDSYRSLAWAVSNAGGYDTTTVPHADFIWANFFRLNIDKDAIDNDFENAVANALPLAHSMDAQTLPGYIP